MVVRGEGSGSAEWVQGSATYMMTVGTILGGRETLLCIWKLSGCTPLEPGLENFEHYFASVWDECNCAVVWHSLALPFSGIGMKTDLFQSCGHCWVFQICWHTKYSTLTASSFRTLNSSAGIPSLSIALFVVVCPEAHLTSQHWIIEKATENQRNIYFCFTDDAKAFNCVHHNKLWKFLKRWEYQTSLPTS